MHVDGVRFNLQHEFFAGADIESLTGRPQSALNKFIKEELCKRQDMAGGLWGAAHGLSFTILLIMRD